MNSALRTLLIILALLAACAGLAGFGWWRWSQQAPFLLALDHHRLDSALKDAGLAPRWQQDQPRPGMLLLLAGGFDREALRVGADTIRRQQLDPRVAMSLCGPGLVLVRQGDLTWTCPLPTFFPAAPPETP